MLKNYYDIQKCSAKEIEFAETQFDFFYNSETETPMGYLERKREVDLSTILLKIINEELPPPQREAVTELKLKGKRPKDFAFEKSMDLSRVYKTLARAMKTIEQFLKYAVCLQRDCFNAKLTPLEIKKIMTLSSLKLLSPDSVGHRIRLMMAKENISSETVSECLNINSSRLQLLLYGQALPSSEELIKLSAFFDTTADYILKGEYK